MNTRNCVHFTKEAARRAGLVNVDFPKLMKKPRSYLQAVAAANPGRVTVIHMHGKAYLATLPPLGSPVVVASPVTTPVAPAASPAAAGAGSAALGAQRLGEGLVGDPAQQAAGLARHRPQQPGP